MSSSPSTSTKTLLKRDYERLPSITTQDSRTDEYGNSSMDKGKGRELDVPTLSDSQRSIRRERSPTPSMLMRRKTDGEAIRSDNGPRSAGFVDKKTRFNGSESRGKGGKKKDELKRRHSSNSAHTNVYTA
ncbi:hypothetical protein ACMFMF_002091 [Clarireedia jacksonii]